MPATDQPAPWQQKIFPRNLTARAATMVRGNPANARPESGVDNTHPGLEFDARNIDMAFFPGLVFGFQFMDGARLNGLDPALLPAGCGLTAADFSAPAGDDPIHLLYIAAKFGNAPDTVRLAQLYGEDGYEVLRTVRSLEAGPMMVVIGRMFGAGPDTKTGTDFAAQLQDFGAAVQAAAQGQLPTAAPPPLRDSTGRMVMAMLIGNRSDYLSVNGVIEPSVVPPGGLTRSLCAPWQWDFADCGCHYWAANKPDIVIAENGTRQIANFQRPRGTDPIEPPPADYNSWVAQWMSAPDMIRQWEQLPFVIAERETGKATRLLQRSDPKVWGGEEIVAELTYLASIEHALCIEYLYAYYSLKALRDPPGADADAKTRALFDSAQLIRTTAIDEMRHFRWVNEALQLLGAPISLDRATQFRTGENKIEGVFAMRPLTPDCLDYFISVEAPSKVVDEADKLDGLYTHLLHSLERATGVDAKIRREVAEIIKLIIDEGHDHWLRFRQVRDLLDPFDPANYLRVKAPPVAAPDGTKLAQLQQLADECYADLLAGLQIAFESNPIDRNERIKDARQLMYNLDDVGVALASEGVGMLFTLPKLATEAGSADSYVLLRSLAETGKVQNVLEASVDPELKALVAKQRARAANVVSRLAS
jgi:hypothetical protein